MSRKSVLLKLQRYGYPVVAFVAAIAIWQGVVGVFHLTEIILPSPLSVLTTLVSEAGYLASESTATLEEVAVGFAAALILGLALAVLITSVRSLQLAVMPMLVASQEVPQVALAPILLVWFGLGLFPKMIIAFIIAFFPVVMNTAIGLRSVPPELLDLAAASNAKRWRVMWKVKLPYALPNIFTGAKLAVAFAVIGAIVGEFVGSEEGIGYVMMTSEGRLDTPLLFAAICVAVLMGLVLFGAIGLLERWMIPWHVSQRPAQ